MHEHHQMELGSELDIDRQIIQPNSNGNFSSDGKSTSIHISFSDNYMPEQREIVQNHSRQLDLNNISDSSQSNKYSKL